MINKDKIKTMKKIQIERYEEMIDQQLIDNFQGGKVGGEFDFEKISSSILRKLKINYKECGWNVEVIADYGEYVSYNVVLKLS